MSITKTGWMWLEQIVMLPRNLAKVAAINRYLECEKELAEAKDRLKQAEKYLAAERAVKAGRMFFRNNVVWAKGEDGEIEDAPYCARCFELNGKLVHLIMQKKGLIGVFDAACPECRGYSFQFERQQQAPRGHVDIRH
jgi:hypothetical protein